ncbi:MAG: HDOD domain-containing protein [Gammaproteobacteria bacterium]
MIANQQLASIKPSDLPAPPQAAIQIMRACSRQDITSKEISALATSDPVLTAELLRVVNSPFFGLSREVQSIPRAITVLGQKALRNLALCISVRDALKGDQIHGFNAVEFWEDSLRRAVSAQIIGQACGLDKDECFTAGLLQDFGLLVMFFFFQEKGGLWPTFHGLDPDRRLDEEKAHFNTTHSDVTAMLTRTWELPDNLTIAFENHHIGDQGTKNKIELARILHSADWTAAIFTATDKISVLGRCKKIVSQELGKDEQWLNDCLTAIPGHVKNAADALGLRIQQQTDFDEILQKATTTLADEDQNYQELTWKLEKAIRERDQLADALNKELMQARIIQQGLLPSSLGPGFPLTGINIPARELSGDFFDYFELPDGRIYFNVGDVSGKGANAALLMVKTCSLFRCLGKFIHEPAKLIKRINAEICETSIQGMFVALAAGLYNPATRQLLFVNAGSPPGLLVQDDKKILELGATAPPLGVDPDSLFTESVLTLKRFSLYLYSDGIIESRISDGSMLGIQGLINLVDSMIDKSPAIKQQEIITNLCDGKSAPHDDMTLLILEDKSG